MTFWWLIVWWLSDTPALMIEPEPNGWTWVLLFVLALDLGRGWA